MREEECEVKIIEVDSYEKMIAMKAMLAKEVHSSFQALVLQYHPNVTVIYTAN